MDKKQLTMVIYILSIFFLLIFGGLISIYFVNPSLIGLAPKNLIGKDSTAKSTINTNDKAINSNNIPINPSITISLNRVLELEKIEQQKNNYDSAINNMNNTVKLLRDSVSNLLSIKINVNDTISKANLKYDNLSKENIRIIDSLNKIMVNYNKDKQRLVLLENRVKSQEDFISKQQDSLELKNFADFAKMYNGVAPADVARILEQIDERDAAKILKLMQSRKASKVLEAMPSEKSAAILLLGAIK